MTYGCYVYAYRKSLEGYATNTKYNLLEMGCWVFIFYLKMYTLFCHEIFMCVVIVFNF